MDFKRLARGEWIAVVGGLLIAVSIFLPSYKTSDNPNADMLPDTVKKDHGSFSVWDVHPVSRWVMLLAALSPFILAYIIARNYELSWPRGQLTSVIAIFALGFSVYWGWISRPGEPSGEISLRIGWVGILVGAILMLVGSFMRQAETEVKRKPPGTL